MENDSYTPHEVSEECLEPWHYLLDIPGKGVRGRLIDAFQLWLKIPVDKVEIIKDMVRSLHTASLLVDDIEDNSKLRRGQPVAHSVYGVPTVLNCANYVYFLAMEKCLSLNDPRATHIIVGELLNLHRGQGLDIHWRENLQCPTLEEYEAMVKDKTGGLFRLSTKLMQIFSSNKHDYSPLADMLGLYFQVRDDLINLASAKYQENKSYCEDLTEGKFSFPIIHAIRSNPSDRRLLAVLKQRTTDKDLKTMAVEWMRKSGSFVFTREYLRSLKTKVEAEIDKLGGHSGLVLLLSKLSEEVEECVC